MAVKIIRLKSGEELVADVKEVMNRADEGDRPIAYMLDQPCIIGLEQEKEPEYLTEDGSEDQIQARLIIRKWMIFTNQTQQMIPLDWVVTFADPTDDVLGVYNQRLEAEQAEPVNTTEEEINADPDPTVQE